MTEAIRWWLVLQVIGTALLPLCLALFRRLPDRGYSLSKPFGLLLTGYLFWLLNNASMKYVLESYTDYAGAPTQPDAKCPGVSSATGVGPKDIDSRWHFTTH